MDTETKKCQNCQNGFTIAPEDFAFYEKIKVPIPSFCFRCIWQRLLSWRNERFLTKRKCDAHDHDESMVSVFSADSMVRRVYDHKTWWSDSWDAMSHGRSYDFSKNFFEQFGSLLAEVPQPNMIQTNAVNCEYSNSILDAKNCYLAFAGSNIENIYYSSWLDYGKDCMDVFWSYTEERCYENVLCTKSYNLKFSAFSEECSDSSFLWDCRGCSSCFGCVGLRNKNYHIFNKPYYKEEYFREIQKYDTGSFFGLNKIAGEFREFKLKQPHKYARVLNTVDSTGDNLVRTKNFHYSFDSRGGDCEDCRYIVVTFGAKSKDSHSSFGLGHGFTRAYQSASVINGSSVMFSKKIWTGYNVQYSYNCHNSNNLFGCVGLRNKSYCILNRQYTKEQYESLVPKIIDHMNQMPYTDSKGRIYKYGEFFPSELSPFAYNETIAQEYFPLTKQEAISQGFKWKEEEKRDYQITKTANDLPDHIKDVTDDILKETIQCAHNQECNEQCTKAYRLIPQELEFYRKHNLPIPRLCPNCRHYQRLKQRNPLRLWERQCMCGGTKSENGVYDNQVNHFHNQDHCPNTFQTSYSPDRKEIIYCEQCYNSEIV